MPFQQSIMRCNCLMQLSDAILLVCQRSISQFQRFLRQCVRSIHSFLCLSFRFERSCKVLCRGAWAGGAFHQIEVGTLVRVVTPRASEVVASFGEGAAAGKYTAVARSRHSVPYTTQINKKNAQRKARPRGLCVCLRADRTGHDLAWANVGGQLELRGSCRLPALSAHQFS